MMVFTAVATLGSFTAASEKLGLSRARVSQIVSLLEQQLNVKLLNRTTRSISLTEVGAQYLEKCLSIHDLAEEANAIARDAEETVSGVLRIKTPIGATLIAPVLAAFLRRYPDIRIELIESDTVVDQVEARIDVAFASGPVADTTLRCVPVGHLREILCASKAYLDENRRPKNLNDLINLDWICHREEQKNGGLQVRRSGNDKTKLQMKPKVVASSVAGIRNFVINNAGFCVLPAPFVGEELKSGQVERILPEYHGYDIPIFLSYGQQNMVPLKVRVFLDFIQENLKFPYD
jgi:DNA-binding transcriptional LysR family regulator